MRLLLRGASCAAYFDREIRLTRIDRALRDKNLADERRLHGGEGSTTPLICRACVHGRLLTTRPARALFLAAPAQADDSRYALANGCYELTSGGQKVAGPFRMKATALGSYMLYTTDQDFFAASRRRRGRDGRRARGPTADWTVDGTTGAFTLTVGGAKLAATDGKLVRRRRKPFGFAEAAGCAVFPESEVGVEGAPSKGTSPWGDRRRLPRRAHALDGLRVPRRPGALRPAVGPLRHHRRARPTAPTTRSRAARATCSRPRSAGRRPTTPTGWPTFSYWPNYCSADPRGHLLQVGRAGLARRAAAVRQPLRRQRRAVQGLTRCKDKPDCNEMDTVRLEMQRLRELQDYVDAQNGGPGKGWFRIVTTPFEARKVIASGKLGDHPGHRGLPAVRLHDQQRRAELRQGQDRPEPRRGLQDGRPRHGARQQVRQRVRRRGRRQRRPRAPSSTAATRSRPASYWDMKTCQGAAEGDYDKTQIDAARSSRRSPALTDLVRPARARTAQRPVYPPPPHCNTMRPDARSAST